MRKILHWVTLAFVLIAAGVIIMTYKINTLGYPLTPEREEASWTVQARVSLRPGNGPVKVDLRLPANTPGYARLQEDFISRGFGLSVQDDPWQREANWAVRRSSGRQVLYYRGIFYRDRSNRTLAPDPAYPKTPELDEPFHTAMLALVESVREQSADIATFASEMIARVNDPSPSEEMRLFLRSPRYQGNKVAITRLLLAGARIPTEQLNGLMLSETGNRTTPTRWVAVHNDQQWLYFDPDTGQELLPEDFLVWWLGDGPAVSIDGGSLVELQWSVRENTIGAISLADQRARAHGSVVSEISLKNLPVQTQTVYSILLLVPVGAFVIVLMRNLIGFRSFGTFMPVLIALAFRETGIISGIVLFGLVVALGLTFRFYLEKLRLLLVPRLTAVLTIVVILMVAVSILSHRLGIEVGLSVGLFPMVILAMVIERMSIVWEERGATDALMEGAGSLVIAALAFLVMSLSIVQHMVFVFPECLLVLLGLTIFMGRYTGYRFSEIMRFRALS